MPLGRERTKIAATAETFAGTVVDGGGDVSYTTPENATTSNNQYAHIDDIGDSQFAIIVADNFGFSVPSNATIVGILLRSERRATPLGSDTIIDDNVQLLKAGVASGDDKSDVTAWVTVEAVRTWGGATDMWGTTWTPANVNHADFGCTITSYITGYDAGCSADIDAISMIIYYTVPASSGTPTVGQRMTQRIGQRIGQ